MKGFKEFVFCMLVAEDYITEDTIAADDLTMDFILTETMCEQYEVEDAWNQYVGQCAEECAEPINDLDGFEVE